MQTFGAFHIKTHLSQILKDIAETGETVAITRHGRTIALLTPVLAENPISSAIESIRKNRKGVNLGKNLSLKSLIEDGRR
jgi:antitoxin (DNA-binding transcriptional repressor) of toxin-antitoxin stability system